MDDFFFTFGSGARSNKYVRITALTKSDARELMFRWYNDKWAFCYSSLEFAGQVEEYGLTELEHLVADSFRNNGE